MRGHVWGDVGLAGGPGGLTVVVIVIVTAQIHYKPDRSYRGRRGGTNSIPGWSADIASILSAICVTAIHRPSFW